MQIRKLTAEDLWILSGIAEKISADLFDLFSKEELDKQDERRTGIQIVLVTLKYFPNEIKEFLAHVTDQTTEELDKKSFTEPVKILRALWKKEEFKDFLDELKSFYSEITPKQST